jgi:hypothetical protein
LSNRNISDFPAFDLLSGKATRPPYRGFGDVIEDSRELERKLRADAAQVRKDVREIFHAKLETATSTPKELDDIVARMWETGWDPNVGNLGLFNASFGLLLTEATLDLLGGTLIFRSPGDDVDIHNSILWPGVEAFPFHKAFKCLTQSDGESMAYFVRGVGHELKSKGLLTAEMREQLPKAD